MKVGLSLSFCVRDICEGKVNLKDVRFISSGTKAETKEHWEEVIDGYRQLYWYDYPDEAESIARKLINDGLVLQPRLEQQFPIAHYITGGRKAQHWIEEEEYNQLAPKKPEQNSRFES